MTLNDILMVADPDIKVEIYLNDGLVFIGAVRPLYALKYLASGQVMVMTGMLLHIRRS